MLVHNDKSLHSKYSFAVDYDNEKYAVWILLWNISWKKINWVLCYLVTPFTCIWWITLFVL